MSAIISEALTVLMDVASSPSTGDEGVQWPIIALLGASAVIIIAAIAYFSKKKK
ncbi:MAG: LPXTG cell wall anchor domain-containing protein [Clostridia bacterium]|nr:LPXTG cell wall anchor domain-containing protein [Clostridia bacterium]